MSRLILVMLLTALMSAGGCEQNAAVPEPKEDSQSDEVKSDQVTLEDVGREAGKALDVAREFSRQKKEEIQQSLDTRLTELDVEIGRLREKGSELKDEARTKWEQKLADLETRRNAVREQITKLSESGGEAWKDLHQGAQSALEELDQAFRKASDEFR